jgi:hypothetical protein
MLRLFAVLIRGPSHWSLLPTHLVVVVAALVEVVILESAIVKKEPWKKTTFFCFEIFQQCQSTLSMQQQYKPFIANINL